MLKPSWFLVLPALACAEPPPPRAAEAPPAASADPPVPSAEPAPRPEPAPAPQAVPLPSLSTPNAKPPAATDAGAVPASSDPLRRIGESAQACHEKHAAGIKGKLVLRIRRDASGAVTSVDVVKARSSAELGRPAFLTCVTDAVKKERLAPPRDADDELELPLGFEPTP